MAEQTIDELVHWKLLSADLMHGREQRKSTNRLGLVYHDLQMLYFKRCCV